MKLLPALKLFPNSTTESARKLLEDIDGFKKIEKEIKEMKFVKDVMQDLKSMRPFQVICHGDCWTNNILFK